MIQTPKPCEIETVRDTMTLLSKSWPMVSEEEVALQDGAFYARRFILSSCMNWNDVMFLRQDGNKSAAWRKAIRTNMRIHPTSWKLELASEKDTWEKSQIDGTSLEETKDADPKTNYVLVRLKKGDLVSFASPEGKRDALNMIYCALMYLIDEPPLGNLLVEQKTQEFEGMINSVRQFLSLGASDSPLPPVPALPPTLKFITPLPTGPA
jgi:hypothetical protein